MKKNDTQFEDIELSKIDENPDNQKIFNMDDIEFLANSISKEGFIGAINVYLQTNGRYEIASGHRRYRAMQLLNKKTIPCIVTNIPDETKKNLQLISSNIQTRKLKPMDISRAIDYYQKTMLSSGFKGNLKEMTAQYFNISYGHLYRYKCLLELIPELQQLTEDGSFPFTALHSATQLTKDNQHKLYEIIISKQEGLKTLYANNPDMPEKPISYEFVDMMAKNLKVDQESSKKDSSIIKPNFNQVQKTSEHDDFVQDYSADAEDVYMDVQSVSDDEPIPSSGEAFVLNDKQRQTALENEITNYFEGLNKIVQSDYFNDKTKVESYISKLETIIKELKKKL